MIDPGTVKNVIDLGLKLIQYGIDVANAPADAEELRNQLLVLSALLRYSKDLDFTSSKFSSIINLKDDTIKQCEAKLNDAYQRVGQVKGIGQFMWPFTVKETKELLLEVKNLQSLLMQMLIMSDSYKSMNP